MSTDWGIDLTSHREHAMPYRALLAAIVAMMLSTSVVPLVGGAGDDEPRGYLVLWDSVPIGPDLDVDVHVVVPGGVTVLSASLEMWGTLLTAPIAPLTGEGGLHAHTLETAGTHDHVLTESDPHDHTVDTSGNHTHISTVEDEVFSLEAAKMSVTLQQHGHIPFGATVSSYNFPPTTSQPHTHTTEAHGHGASVLVSGTHSHTTSVDAAHSHAVETTGDHSHDSTADGAHLHELVPGVAVDTSGTRPSGVNVSLTHDGVTSRLTSVYGASDADWHGSADLSGDIEEGMTLISLTSETRGTLEYLVVVAIDAPYAVLAGRGAIGPDVALEVPLVAPKTPLEATVYLFGAPQAMASTEVKVAGGHQHTIDAVADHSHAVDAAGSHAHIVGGGGHEHDVNVSGTTVLVDARTPTWDLAGHSHSLTWLGGVIDSVGTYSYGTVSSLDHTHTTLAHGHTVTFEDSGAHAHNLTEAGIHTHTVAEEPDHTHTVGTASVHDHGLVMTPSRAGGAGPSDVRLSVDGTDITDAQGGPWALTGMPTEVQLEVSGLEGEHALDITSTTVGDVEWLIVMLLPSPGLLVSVRSLGDLAAHMPIPAKTTSGTAWVRATPYVMPFERTTTVMADHTHVTSTQGAHAHTVSEAGDHSHALDASDHAHGMVLEDALVSVQDATASVDLPSHDHTVGGGFPTSTSTTRIQDVTGTHTHDADAHNHTANWTTSGEHDHSMDMAPDHDHQLGLAGAHSHTVLGGSHSHLLEPGTYWDETFTSSSGVSLSLRGGAVASGLHTASDARWWERLVLPGALLVEQDAATLVATSATLGTLSVIVALDIDLEAPTFSVVDAPEWVRKGTDFQVTVSVPSDIDPGTLLLGIEDCVVKSTYHDTANARFVFNCSVLGTALDGMRPIVLQGSDRAGNAVEVTLATLGVDSTMPTAELTVGGPKVEGTGFTWVSPTTPVTIDVQDALSGPGEVVYVLGPVTPAAVRHPYGEGDPLILRDLPDGDIDLTFLVSDVAGNARPQLGPMRLRIDGTAPNATVSATPSSTVGTPPATWVGLGSMVSLQADDGATGSQVERIEYMLDDGTATPTWRVYDQPFKVPQSPTGDPPSFTVSCRAIDRLGNGEGTDGVVAVFKLDTAAPLAPSSGLTLPGYTNVAKLRTAWQLDPDVARVNIRTNVSDVASVPAGPGGWFNASITLEDGPNDVLVSVEDAVGNASPWTLVGTVVLDTVAPRILSTDPSGDADGVAPGKVTVAIELSEECTVTVKVYINGLEVDSRLAGDGASSTRQLVSIADVPGNRNVELRIGMTDRAGNNATSTVTFRTGDEGLGLGDFLWGIIIGAVLGIVVLFIVLSRAWRGRSALPTPDRPVLLDEGLPRGKDILSPDDAKLVGQRGPPEEEAPVLRGPMGRDPTAPATEDTRPGPGVSSPEVGTVEDEGPDGLEGPSDEDDLGDGSVVEDEDEGKDEGDDEGNDEDDDDSDGDEKDHDGGLSAHAHDREEPLDPDISDEIDRLLEDAMAGDVVQSEPGEDPTGDEGLDEELPDPDEETVDPGAR